MKFCKLFEINGDQVLFTKTKNEEGEPAVAATIATKLGMIEACQGYTELRWREEAFNAIDEAFARKRYEQLHATVAQFDPTTEG